MAFMARRYTASEIGSNSAAMESCEQGTSSVRTCARQVPGGGAGLYSMYWIHKLSAPTKFPWSLDSAPQTPLVCIAQESKRCNQFLQPLESVSMHFTRPTIGELWTVLSVGCKITTVPGGGRSPGFNRGSPLGKSLPFSRATTRSRKYQFSTGLNTRTNFDSRSKNGWLNTSSGTCWPTKYMLSRSAKWLQLLVTTSYVSRWKIGFNSLTTYSCNSSWRQSVWPRCTTRVGTPKLVWPGWSKTVSLA
mmetsp:Transcript_84500/g.235732  ORF Transcript_84500/g.235732 Transcript_84500/m.235732 type:complete len:247 (-) Transcript_84500:1001-1741(-)